MSKFLDKLDREDSLPKTIVYNNNPADNFTIATMLGNFQRDLSGKMQFDRDGGTLTKETAWKNN